MQDVLINPKMPENYEQLSRENQQLNLALKNQESFLA